MRFAAAYTLTKATSQVVVGLDDDDPHLEEYTKRDWPASFKLFTVPKHGPGACFVQNQIFEAYGAADVYGILADDLIPVSPKWDKVLADAAGRDQVSYGADGQHDDRFATHPFIGGDLVRSKGFIAPPGLHHLYVDNYWWDVGAMVGIKYCEDVRLEHHHWSNGKAEKDDVYRHSNAQGDEAAYRRMAI